MSRAFPDFVVNRGAEYGLIRPQTSLAFDHLREYFPKNRRLEDAEGMFIRIVNLFLDDAVADINNHDLTTVER